VQPIILCKTDARHLNTTPNHRLGIFLKVILRDRCPRDGEVSIRTCGNANFNIGEISNGRKGYVTINLFKEIYFVLFEEVICPFVVEKVNVLAPCL
jgi:hypothetical protein